MLVVEVANEVPIALLSLLFLLVGGLGAMLLPLWVDPLPVAVNDLDKMDGVSIMCDGIILVLFFIFF